MKINPTEKRDQHCKIYVEKSIKDEINNYATRHSLTFSEAGRDLLLAGLHVIGVK